MGFFYLASVHSENVHQAQHLANKYHGQTFCFNAPNGIMDVEPSRMTANSHREGEEWWTDIWCMDVTDSGLADAEECRHANEFANIIYGFLRNEPFFDYAIAGVEVGQFRNLAEFIEMFQDMEFVAKFDGLVIRRTFAEKHNLNVAGFVEFSPTHVWIPKLPEKKQ